MPEPKYTELEDMKVLNDPVRQFDRGVDYLESKGGEQSDQKAFALFKKSAAQGHVPAYANLAYCYMEGRGVARDEKAAVDWYHSAAKSGDVNAQFSLGAYYQNVLEKVNPQQAEQYRQAAISWYRAAAAQGDAEASIRAQELQRSQPVAAAKTTATLRKDSPVVKHAAPKVVTVVRADDNTAAANTPAANLHAHIARIRR
jgi:TPR repeat protein